MQRIIFILTSFLLCLSTATSRTVAYFYALDEDWRRFSEFIGEPIENIARSGFTFARVRMGNEVIYGIKMGSGAVQTALSSQALLAFIPIDLAFSTGPVGALSDDLQVGQVFRVEKVIPWQTIGVLTPAGAGSVPTLAIQAPAGDWSEHLRGYQIISVASGEVFVETAELRDRIQSATEAEAVDMNLFGLISALKKTAVPSIHLRVVSDKANEKAVADFTSFRTSYRGDLGLQIGKIIKNLPTDATDPEAYSELKTLFDK